MLHNTALVKLLGRGFHPSTPKIKGTARIGSLHDSIPDRPPNVTVQCVWDTRIRLGPGKKDDIIYTVNHKKRDILFLTITLANLNRFLQFLYHFKREEILHATVVKFITSP